jgi:hypothetical protein
MALFAQLLVPINAPVNEPVNEPVLICAELLTVPSATGAYDADIATDADCAQLAVPNNGPLWIPTNDPLNDPVLI